MILRNPQLPDNFSSRFAIGPLNKFKSELFNGSSDFTLSAPLKRANPNQECSDIELPAPLNCADPNQECSDIESPAPPKMQIRTHLMGSDFVHSVILYSDNKKNNKKIYVQIFRRMTLQGTPQATTLSGISFVTTLPAPITVLFPMVTPGIIIAPPPIQTLFPIRTGAV